MPEPLLQLGKYIIHEELGRGGFGTVYRATDTILNSEVALKVLHPALSADPGFLHRFEQEARSVRQLEHPHIVTIYELHASDGRHYIAMQLMRGGSLADRFQAEDSITPEETAKIIEEIAAALDHAHSHGYVHRDIKPSNVLFDSTGRAVLADFGLARAVDASMSSGGSSAGHGMAGTAAYVAPEIWDGKKADPATDIYALGCVAYEMLSGQRVFDGLTTSAVMRAHFQPRHFPPNWSAALQSCFEQVLSIDPKDRFATAKAFAAALSTVTARENVPEKLPRPRRRLGLLAALAGTLAIAVISALLLLQARSCQPTATPARTAPVVTVTSTPSPTAAPAAATTPARSPTLDLASTPSVVIPLVTPDSQPLPPRGGSAAAVVIQTPDRPLINATNVTDLRALHTMTGHEDWLRSIAFSPDGAYLASCSQDGTVRIWSTAEGSLLKTLKGHTGTVWSLAYAPDGETIASGAEDHTVRLWRAIEGKEIARLPILTNGILDLAFTPGGAELIISAYGGELELWDIQKQSRIRQFTGHREAVFSVAISPDGQTLASGGADNVVRLWDLASGKPRAELAGHTDWVRDIAFSPDAALLASTGADQTAILWHVADSSLLKTLRGHTRRIAALAFSPDGLTLATASYDGTVRFWGTRDGAQVGALRAHAEGVTALAFSPDQTMLATGSPDLTIRIWTP